MNHVVTETAVQLVFLCKDFFSDSVVLIFSVRSGNYLGGRSLKTEVCSACNISAVENIESTFS